MIVAYRPLSYKDKANIIDLYQRASDYFILSEGQIPDDCDELLYDLPPGKSSHDKVLLGMFYLGKLIGIVDCIMGFPVDSTCLIGLLLIDQQFRKLGMGKSAFNHIRALAKTEKMEVVRIGVIDSNESAISFWSKVGFRQVETKGPEKFATNSHMIYVMERLC